MTLDDAEWLELSFTCPNLVAVLEDRYFRDVGKEAELTRAAAKEELLDLIRSLRR